MGDKIQPILMSGKCIELTPIMIETAKIRNENNCTDDFFYGFVGEEMVKADCCMEKINYIRHPHGKHGYDFQFGKFPSDIKTCTVPYGVKLMAPIKQWKEFKAINNFLYVSCFINLNKKVGWIHGAEWAKNLKEYTERQDLNLKVMCINIRNLSLPYMKFIELLKKEQMRMTIEKIEPRRE